MLPCFQTNSNTSVTKDQVLSTGVRSSRNLCGDNEKASEKLEIILPQIRQCECIFLPPQGFGPEAKTRGGTLGVPACIHTRTKNIC